MCNHQWKKMANLHPTPTTERNAPDPLDEEDERERVLLVEVQGVRDSFKASGTDMHLAGRSSQIAGAHMALSDESNDAGGLRTYAMNVRDVREVIRARAVTRVPVTPRHMSGLVNVRGQVVTVLDLARCLELAAGEPAGRGDVPIADSVTEPSAQTAGSIVLLEHGGRLVGLVVHGVRDVRPLDDAGMASEHSVLAATLVAESAGIKKGLASAGGEVVTLLDVAALLSRHLISSGET